MCGDQEQLLRVGSPLSPRGLPGLPGLGASTFTIEPVHWPWVVVLSVVVRGAGIDGVCSCSLLSCL